MMTVIEPPSALSSPQRRSQVLLMFYLPGQSVTTERLGRINLVDETTARQDIEETGREIQRYHRLTLRSQVDGSYRIEGAALDQRLCLLHALRRGLRLCPQFVNHHFTPALKTQLKQEGIARTLYDDTNLQALVNRCARALNRQFTAGTSSFCACTCSTACLSITGAIHPTSMMNSNAGRRPPPSSLWRRRLSATGSAGSALRRMSESLFSSRCCL